MRSASRVSQVEPQKYSVVCVSLEGGDTRSACEVLRREEGEGEV